MDGSDLRSFGGIPSGRPQPTLPVDDSRCWIYDEELSWRFFDVGRIADPPIEIRETELEWQDRIGWDYAPVASGYGVNTAKPQLFADASRDFFLPMWMVSVPEAPALNARRS